jgi:hypothetical protein
VATSRSKRVTRQTLIGEGGVALISQRVNEMGYLYHDRRVDHGIDGEIELVGPNGEALNRVIMVQSKASNRRQHAYETADSFQWAASKADLDYWLSGNAPVIVVLSRPAEKAAWWFDVRAEFGTPRRRAERTVIINKHMQSFDESAASALFHLGTPRDSGVFLASPPKKELLTSNLLPIESWPDTLFIAPTSVRTYGDGWERLKSTPGHADGWILHDGMLVSFGDLRAAPLQGLCDGGVERLDSYEWAFSDDEDTTHRFADLLRRTLASDRRRDLQWHKTRDHLYFRATRDLKPRREGRGGGRRGRTVFGPHYSKAEPERVSYYHHAALKPRFRRIGERWYCQLGVDYCFTRDGRNEVSFADGLLAGIKRMDRHPAVLGWTLMWERYLQGDLFSAESLLTFGALLTFEVDRGIDDAWWRPAPTAGGEDEAPDGPDFEKVLQSAGVDQGDLLSLFDEAPGPDRRSPSPRRAERKRR